MEQVSVHSDFIILKKVINQMLGSINTGGFSKSQVDAMKDSNYFQRRGVPGVYDAPNPKAKKETGDFLVIVI